ncbi:MAG TPA: right-handed parallel beta-helix repeat-containing protein, partial [Chloroflexota bacterium]|nr:right-handed parallel beta-helix repeat-containing protein [Chloroflexota bacterium]
MHTLGGGGEFDQIVPKDGNTYIGGPGAVIDGTRTARYAFTGRARDVTLRYLTIQAFGAPGTNNNEGVVNHDAGSGWTVEFNTIQGNAGAGLFMGSGNIARYNCLLDNEQYGVSMYLPPTSDGKNAITDITLDHNEIAGNNTYDWESKIAGCGCTGGAKFWDVGGARISNNWVHHNKGVGLWADTNNVDFLVEGNYIEENDGMGFFYEISYNAVVRNNVFKRNAIKTGLEFQARGDNFPLGAIYLSEAGGDARVSSALTGTTNLEITGNRFEDNWDGVVLWENADRFFNSLANTSGTAYVPKGGVASTSTCNDPAAGGSINVEPAYSDCRWKTQNVKVSGNSFTFDPAAIACTSGFCGRNAVFSQYGTYPAWSPYKGWAISDAITSNQGNVWSNNTYVGPWKFVVHDTGRTVSASTWQASPYNHDAGSTLSASDSTTTEPAPTTTTTAPPTTTTTAPVNGNHLNADTTGMEESVGSWVPWYSAGISRSTLHSHTGIASARIDIGAPDGWGVQLDNWPGFAATPGPKTIGFWGYLDSGSNLGATMTVRWRNDAGID